nr:bHLH63 [Pinus massoniana]
MSIPSGLDSIFLSCEDGMFVDPDSMWDSISFQSKQTLEDRPSYNIHHAQRSDLVDTYNSGIPIDHHDLLNVRTIRNSSLPTDRRSCNSLTPTAQTERRCNKKMIEKQRRKDMKIRFSRLRSLLPEEYLRGKRAESDQVLGAISYIGHLQQSVEAVSRERDRLKANLNRQEQMSSVRMHELSSNEKFSSKQPWLQRSDEEFPTVEIKSIHSGVRISLNVFEDQIVYSNLLLALEECGLEVVNATSSSVNNKVFHNIYNKVSDINKFNEDNLCEKLRYLIFNQEADLRALDSPDQSVPAHK